MCMVIQIEGGDRIDSCGELWALVGKDNVVFTQVAEFDPNDCLCHVDAEATAARTGFDSRSGWDESGCDYIWKKL